MFGRRSSFPTFLVFLGPFFVLGAAILIFWNESHTLRTANSLTEGNANVVEATTGAVDPGREGKLVHLTGEATTEETLRDPAFGVETRGLRLTRVVEICESTEDKRSLDPNNNRRNPDGFRANWRDLSTAGSAQSGRSGNGNNADLPTNNAAAAAYRPMVFTVGAVRVGAYGLGKSLFSQLSDSAPLPLTADAVRLPPGAQLLPGGQIYLGADPAVPRVGDLRVTEKVTPLGPVSVVAAQRGDRLVPHLTRAGGEVGLVQRGDLDASEMFGYAHTTNKFLAWLLRVLGFLGLFFGVRCLIAPLSRIGSFVPVLGMVVAEGALLLSFLGALLGWSLLVSLAWMFARPLAGLGMLAVVGIGVALLVPTLRKRAARRRHAPADPSGLMGQRRR